jgi:cell division septum initiation protein DivIVA
MSKSTSQIEREIEATRAEIEGTLAALRSRMSLGEVVEEVSRQFRATGGPDMMRNFGRQVRENPLPLALIGAGIAWLVIGNGRAAYRHEHELEPYDLDGEYDPDYEYNPYTGTHASQLPPTGTGPSAGASVAPGAQLGADGGGEEKQRRGMASGLSESVSDAASRAGETASSAAAAVGDRASAMADTVARQARWAARRTGAGAARAGRGVQRSFLDLVEEQPLVVGALGIAVGAAIGALLPSTRTEDRWVGPTRDRVRDEAARVGREQYEKATHVAEKAYESAKAEADAQGLTPQQDKTVAERVEEVAKAAAETAQTEAKREGLGKP